MYYKFVLLVFHVVTLEGHAEFVFPQVILEAYKPKGFRASIPAVDGIQMFAFHGSLNKEISQVDPGEFSEDFTRPSENNMWSYFNKDLTLKIGDVVHYWLFVQFEKLGYRKDAQSWRVTELIKLEDTSCDPSPSVVARRAVICKNSLVFEENFNNKTINKDKWRIEEYIPYTSEDYEFVSYQNRPDVCYISNNKLFIKPKPAMTDNDVRGELDLRSRCTKQSNEECYVKQELSFILPPVTSGKLVSLVNFRYGKVEIKAKLPAGDWIYPQIYLEQVSDPSKKIWIAYARGNVHLYAHNGEDIGGHMLFGGPVLHSAEPHRSTYLKTIFNKNSPLSSQMHTYTVIWDNDHISLLLDNKEYGKIDGSAMRDINFAENDMANLVLGVGVGGINDFPDDFRSGDSADIKPWSNKARSQMKSFFKAREHWLKSWAGDNSALQVEYVKIFAL